MFWGLGFLGGFVVFFMGPVEEDQDLVLGHLRLPPLVYAFCARRLTDCTAGGHGWLPDCAATMWQSGAKSRLERSWLWFSSESSAGPASRERWLSELLLEAAFAPAECWPTPSVGEFEVQ